MDHHCPWTINCVSYRTFPHFFRFLLYAVISMSYLEYFLYLRGLILWNARHQPSVRLLFLQLQSILTRFSQYLGPSATQMMFLLVFCFVNSITLFALSILLAHNVWLLGENMTTIEGWELERHETLLSRAKAFGGYVDGPDGIRVRIDRHEFPYDIGIFQNIRQGLGGNILLWLWPLAPTPTNEGGLQFETNGFERKSLPVCKRQAITQSR